MNTLRTKRAFEVKQKAFFIILKWLSVTKNCLRPEIAPLRLFLTSDISFPSLTPQTAIFCFINGLENSVYKITNHILLIFKLHVYKSKKDLL